MSSQISKQATEAFPFLEQVFSQDESTPSISSLLTKLPKGTTVFREGDECSGIAFILSISCVFNHKSFVAFADIDEDCEVLLVPPNLFRQWLRKNEKLTEWVFGLLANRLDSVLVTVEEVAFQRVDRRIADFLLDAETTTSGRVVVTHQQLATELGTSREVVSRILKDFEKKGLLSIHRGTIQIEAIEELKKYTRSV